MQRKTNERQLMERRLKEIQGYVAHNRNKIFKITHYNIIISHKNLKLYGHVVSML